ncbi:hypothetical protein [Candidatus Uabimicrobium amorphum]|uniref:Uncharacterized protein n=1 Tax=Uabimicrobium amorphum TaxID=2596890 RepID=A0A5S9F7N6_UABAM|nr:hypothetical protein [Candidatus Uabimicrobium amorphum]BBM87844.1 hypothetical protein UABAM_06259 [Candidatus Uabimicrobium amorphum]
MLKLPLTSSKKPGFRLSIVDVVFILFSGVATYIVYPYLLSFTWIIPLVVGHFFLFCNVFRVRRNLELLWAAVFCGNIIVHFYTHFSWTTVLMVQIPATVLVITLQIISPNYRGIFYKWKNGYTIK